MASGGAGLLFLGMFRLLIAWLLVEHGILGMWVSVVVVHGLSCPLAHGFFPDQEQNLCSLHWQVDSLKKKKKKKKFAVIFLKFIYF